MKAGFTLDPQWIGPQACDEFLAPFTTAGLRVLEFILHPFAEDWIPIKTLAEECVEAGYACHIHAPYLNPFNPAGFASARRTEVRRMFSPALELTERLARRGGFTLALVIHGARGTQSLDELTRDTREFLAWALSETQLACLALELLPPKKLTRVGERREEVFALVREIDHPRLGICWDLGHDAILGYKDLPSEDFLRAVRHVHIHDRNSAGEDHFPLIYGNVPWQQDLRALSQVGYTGAVTLELNFKRAQTVARLNDRIVDSFSAMRAVMDEALTVSPGNR